MPLDGFPLTRLGIKAGVIDTFTPLHGSASKDNVRFRTSIKGDGNCTTIGTSTEPPTLTTGFVVKTLNTLVGVGGTMVNN